MMRTERLGRARPSSAFLLACVVGLAGCAAPSPSSPRDGSSLPTAPATLTPSYASSAPTSATSAPSTADIADTWIRLDDMSVPRGSLIALELLDGRVFVIDATRNVISDLEGGPHPPGPTDILDPATGRWTPADALNAPRSDFVAVRLNDGRVIVTGGDNGWHGSYSSTKLFDPTTGHWTATGLLDTARAGLAGALLADGRVLVAGGTYSEGYKDQDDFDSGRDLGGGSLKSAELYDPATGRWTVTGSLHAESGGDAYTLPDGRVLIVGDVGEVYDPATGTWASAGNVDRPPESASVVLADGSLLVIGGIGADENQAVATVRRFDPETGITAEVAPLPAPRMGAVAVRLADARVLVAGGQERGWLESSRLAPHTATAFLYEPARDTWTETTPMPFANSPGAALLLSDGSLLVAGGSIPNHRAETDTDTPSDEPVGWTARFVPGTMTGG